MSDLGPAVRDGRIRYTSPSAMTSFDEQSYGGCARKWYFRYVLGRPDKERKATKLGTQVHAQIAHYLKTGEPTLGDIALAGRRFLPKPGPDLKVEVGFAELVWGETSRDPKRPYLQFVGMLGDVRSPLKAAGVPVIGFMDLAHARGEWLDDEGKLRKAPGLAEVADWKTSKQIADEVDPDTGVVIRRGYAKSADELSRTWQMVGYGEVALQTWPADSVALSHGYFQTQGKRDASKRCTVVPAREIHGRWDLAEPLLERMKSVAGEADVKNVSANYSACSAYGGCAYKSECPRDAKALLATFSGGNMDILKMLKNKATASTTPAAAPAPLASVPADVKAEMAKLETEEKAIKAGGGGGITPPDAPAPEKTAEPHPPGSAYATVPAPEPAPIVMIDIGPPPPTPCPYALGKQRMLTVDEVATRKATCSCGQVFKVKPTKLGGEDYYGLIPKHEPKVDEAKAEMKTEKPDAAKPEPKAETRAPEKPILTPAKVVKAEEDSTYKWTFYLDAIEDGVSTKRLEDYANKIAGILADEYKAADVRCAPGDSPLAFGKWKGALAALARHQPPEDGVWAVSSASELGMVIFEALAPHAQRVVRGVR